MKKDIVAATTSIKRRHIWQPFSVRVENVQIHTRPLERYAKDDLEIDSYFKEGLLKWSELDLTIAFSSYYKEVNGKAQTVAQVLHHKEQLISSILAVLNLNNESSLNAFLE